MLMEGPAGDQPVIVVPDCAGSAPVLTSACRHLGDLLHVRIFPDPPADSSELADRIRGADTVVHFFAGQPLDGDVLLRARPERVVVAGPVGASVDTDAAAGGGIAVYETPGLAAPAVAEHTLALMLAWNRGLPSCVAGGAGGAAWRPRTGWELAGRRLGVVGLGRVGTRVAQLAAGIGMHVSAWSPSLTAARAAAAGVDMMELDDLLRCSDVVSLHLRLAPGTREVLDARRLSLMKSDALLVNTARAGLVDMAALRLAVEERRIAGVALDVLDVEPVTAEDPLRQHASVLLTPHCAWMTVETIERFVAAAAGFARGGTGALVRRVV